MVYPHFSPLGNYVQKKENNVFFKIVEKLAAENCEFEWYDPLTKLRAKKEVARFPGKQRCCDSAQLRLKFGPLLVLCFTSRAHTAPELSCCSALHHARKLLLLFIYFVLTVTIISFMKSLVKFHVGKRLLL